MKKISGIEALNRMNKTQKRIWGALSSLRMEP